MTRIYFAGMSKRLGILLTTAALALTPAFVGGPASAAPAASAAAANTCSGAPGGQKIGETWFIVGSCAGTTATSAIRVEYACTNGVFDNGYRDTTDIVVGTGFSFSSQVDCPSDFVVDVTAYNFLKQAA